MNRIVAVVFGVCASLAACATTKSTETPKLLLDAICPVLPNADTLIPDGIKLKSNILAHNGQLLFITDFKKSSNPFKETSTHKLFRLEIGTRSLQPVADIPIWGTGQVAVSGDDIFLSGRTHEPSLLNELGVINVGAAGGAVSFILQLKYDPETLTYEPFEGKRFSALKTVISDLSQQKKKHYAHIMTGGENNHIFLGANGPKRIIVITSDKKTIEIPFKNFASRRPALVHKTDAEIIVDDSRTFNKKPNQFTRIRYEKALAANDPTLIEYQDIDRQSIDCAQYR